MTKYGYNLAFGYTSPIMKVISFGIITSSTGTQFPKKIFKKEDKIMEPGTIALILMFVVGYGGAHLF